MLPRLPHHHARWFHTCRTVFASQPMSRGPALCLARSDAAASLNFLPSSPTTWGARRQPCRPAFAPAGVLELSTRLASGDTRMHLNTGLHGEIPADEHAGAVTLLMTDAKRTCGRVGTPRACPASVCGTKHKPVTRLRHCTASAAVPPRHECGPHPTRRVGSTSPRRLTG